MKKYSIMGIGLVLVLLFTGCSNDFRSDLFEEASPKMKEQVEYREDLGAFDNLVLEVDLTVSGVKISSSDNDDLVYQQIANRKDLLAEMKISEKAKQ